MFLSPGSRARPNPGAMVKRVLTQNNLLPESLNVRSFAAGNGIRDDTAAIIAADAAAAAAGKSLYFPTGSYLVSSTLTPSTGAHWFGDGPTRTTFLMASTTATLFAVSNTAVELDHFQCVPQSSRTNTAITFAISSGSFYIHDVSTNSNGVSFSLSGSTVAGILDRVQTSATVANGIDVDISGSFIVSILNSIFSGNPAARAFAHIVLRNVGGQLQILNTSMFQASQGIVALPGTGQVVTLIKCDTTYVDSNPNGALAITPTSTGNGIVQRFSFVNGWLSDNGAVAATISGSSTTTIDEISIHNTDLIGGSSATLGIEVINATNLSLVNNRLANFSSGTAISLAGVTGASVTGNLMAASIATGISISSASDYLHVHNNDLRGSTTKLTNSSTAAHNDIRLNAGYNPIGVSSISVGASPFTYTAGASPESIYINAGTGLTISYNGTALFQAACTIEADPNSTVTVAYSSAPSMNTAKH